MSGTYSINSTIPPESFSGGVLQTLSTTPCTPRQLTIPIYSQTSIDITTQKLVFDRESGKHFVIQCPFFDLTLSNFSLSFTTDKYRLSLNKLLTLLKCLLILQSLPEAALEEATEEITKIAQFYSDRFPQNNLPTIPASSIKGKLKATQIRPSIILEP